MKNYGFVSPRRLRAFGLGSLLAVGLTLSAVLLNSGASVALAATPTTVAPLAVAPANTTEIWVDVEGANASASITHLSVQQAPNGWNDAAATQTPFGASAVFPAQPGAVDIRFRASAPAVADIAVSYVAADGTVLAERVLLAISLTQKMAGADGWISWSALSEQTGGDPVGPGAASDPLARSGSDGPLLSLALLPVALVAAGMALLFAARRRSRTQQPADQLEGEE